MIKKDDVIEFFDMHAPTWDDELIRSDEKINIILENAGVRAGAKVLDVACGTGVLIPDYLKKGVGSVTGIDISPKMIEIAQSKFRGDNVRFVCGDVESADVGRDYDCVVVYNAFPHFPEPERLIGRLSSLLSEGGILTVAHGMSREAIDKHHDGHASLVSMGLMEAEALKAIFEKYLTVTAVISDDRMYQVAGRK